MNLMQVKDLNKSGKDRAVLKDISFAIGDKEKLAIAGETGSGKTTLLKIMGGLAQADSGNVYLRDKRVQGAMEKLIPGHPEIAFLSQHFELRNAYRVEEILSYANKLPASQASRIFEVCRIDHLLRRRTDELSGGERQRIALARLLVGLPRILLLDEPYSNLDRFHKEALKSVLESLQAELGISCVLCSHDPADLLSWADRVLVLSKGELVQAGSPEILYHRPVNEYVAALFGNYGLLPSELVEQLVSPRTTVARGGQLLVRPEYWEIGATNDRGLMGIVLARHFFGSYWDLDISLQGRGIRVRSNSGEWRLGQQIWMTLKERDHWWTPESWSSEINH